MNLESDKNYMQRAIDLAMQGRGRTSPNPLVGAVIVKDNKIIGEGFHEKYGELHAERNAFKSLKESANGATLYVTLEPCCHYGKTPPCTEAIVENGISKVIIGSRDPNPLVSGKGVKFLKDHDIEVITDFMKDECDKLNPIFFHFIKTNRPYIALKYAMTLDGKIATKAGLSKWITNDLSRNYVHQLRNDYSAILVGINTVLEDDPLLNSRIENGVSPIRIILDSELKIPLDSKIVQTSDDYRTIVAHANRNVEKEQKLKKANIELWYLPNDENQVDLEKLIRKAGKEKIDSILVEGGGTIHEAFLRNNLADHVYAFIAPKLFGGKDAKTPVEGVGVFSPEEATVLENLEIKRFGEDILLEYDIKRD